MTPKSRPHPPLSPLAPRGDRELKSWGFRYALVGFLVGSICGTMAFTFVNHSRVEPTPLTARMASILGLWVGLLGAPIVASRWRGTGSLKHDFGLAARWRDVAIGIAVGVVLQLVAVPIISWPVERIWSVDVERPTRELLDNTGPRIVLYLAIVVGAPFVEELFFRGLVLRSLSSRLADTLAIAITSVLFASSHYQAAQTPALFVVGLTFAVMAHRKRRLGPAIIAHAAFNATALVLALTR